MIMVFLGRESVQNQIPFCFDAFQNPPSHNLESANLRMELLHTGTSGLITLQTRELHYANIINLVNGSIASFQRKKPWSRVGGQIPAKPAANC
jgi:hypothetical protein